MRRIQTLNSKKPPKGFDIIEPQITELIQRLKDAENAPSEGKRKVESIIIKYLDLYMKLLKKRKFQEMFMNIVLIKKLLMQN